MINAARIVLAVLLFAFAGYCLFGFLATFEPGAGNAAVWRSIFGVFGVGSLLGGLLLAFIAWSRREK